MSKNTRNNSAQNLHANSAEESIPTVEFDFTNSTIENGAQNHQIPIKNLKKITQNPTFKRYMTQNPSEGKKSIVDTFTPQSKPPSEPTIEISSQKVEAVQKMNKIIKNHILMNSMIKWIENGFMHFPEGSVSPIPEKDEILEYSAIEKEDDHFLHPITEESLGDIEKDFWGGRSKQQNFENFEKIRLEKLAKVIQMWQDIDNNPEILKLKAFKEWKRLGIKISLEKLLEYRETLDKLQSMPLSEEDYYYEDEDSDISIN